MSTVLWAGIACAAPPSGARDKTRKNGLREAARQPRRGTSPTRSPVRARRQLAGEATAVDLSSATHRPAQAQAEFDRVGKRAPHPQRLITGIHLQRRLHRSH